MESNVNVFQPMVYSPIIYSTTMRTTICDVMCITNTSKGDKTDDINRKTSSPLKASFPYQLKNKLLLTNDESARTSDLQKLKIVEKRNKKNLEFKREKKIFYTRMAAEEKGKFKLREQCAISIQAIYRGHLARSKNDKTKNKRPHYIKKITQTQIHDELCELAKFLNLKPIQGLNLEARSKTSRRWAKIEDAGSIRIQRFFKMLTARKKARERMKYYKEMKENKSACIIQRSFRRLKVKRLKSTMLKIDQANAAVIIQCAIRKFQARQKVRKMRKDFEISSRQRDAATIIQRSITPLKYRHAKQKLEHNIEYLATVCLTMFDGTFYSLYTAELIEEMLDIHIDEQRKLRERERESRESALMEYEDSFSQEYARFFVDQMEKASSEVVALVLDIQADDEIFTAVTIHGPILEAEHNEELQKEREINENMLMLTEDELSVAMRSYLSEVQRISDFACAIVQNLCAHSLVDQAIVSYITGEIEDDIIREITRECCSNLSREVVDAILAEATEKTIKNLVKSTASDDLISVVSMDSQSTINTLVAEESEATSPISPRFLSALKKDVNFVSESDFTALPSESDEVGVPVLEAILPDVNDSVDGGEGEIYLDGSADVEPSAEMTGMPNDELKFTDNFVAEDAEVKDAGVSDEMEVVSNNPDISEMEVVRDIGDEQTLDKQEEPEIGLEDDKTDTIENKESDDQPDLLELRESVANSAEEELQESATDLAEGELRESASKLAEEGVVDDQPEMALEEAVEEASKVVDDSIANDDRESITTYDTKRIEESNVVTHSVHETNEPIEENKSDLPLIDLEEESEEIDVESCTVVEMNDHYNEGIKKFYEGIFSKSLVKMKKAKKIYGHLEQHNQLQEFTPLKDDIELMIAACQLQLASFSDCKSTLDGLRARLHHDANSRIGIKIQVLFLLGEYFCSQALFVESDLIYRDTVIEFEKSGKMMIECSFMYGLLSRTSVALAIANLYIIEGNYSGAQDFLMYAKDHITNATDKIFYHVVVANFFQVKGLYQLALEKYMKSLDLLQNQSYCHNIHPKIAEIENEVGLMAIDLCNFNLASKCLENALEIRETVFAANHPAVGQSYCSKGRLLVAQGRYIEALKFFEKSLTIRAQYYTIHPDLGETLHFLGEVNRLVGFPKAAKFHFDEAYIMRKSCFRKQHHVLVLGTMVANGLNTMNLGLHNDAVELLEKCRDIWSELLPDLRVDRHPKAQLNLVALGHSYMLMSRYAEAQNVIAAAGKVLHTLMGSDHYFVGEALLSLGQLMTLKGRYLDADKMLTRVLGLFTDIFTDSHPEVARVLHAIAENLRLPGEFQNAVEKSTEALNMRLKYLGTKNFWVTMSLHHRAILLRDLNEYDKAAEIFGRILPLVNQLLGEENAHYATVLYDYSESLRLENQFDKAFTLHESVYNLRKKLFGADCKHISIYESLLAMVLIDMEKDALIRRKHALYELENEILPNITTIVGELHPLVAYIQANIGLCMNILTVMYIDSKSSSSVSELKMLLGNDHPLVQRAIESHNKKDDEEDGLSIASSQYPGQDMIDKAMDYLEDYSQMPFTEDHPWIQRFFGGNISSAPIEN